jgi:hypothetical protein
MILGLSDEPTVFTDRAKYRTELQRCRRSSGLGAYLGYASTCYARFPLGGHSDGVHVTDLEEEALVRRQRMPRVQSFYADKRSNTRVSHYLRLQILTPKE